MGSTPARVTIRDGLRFKLLLVLYCEISPLSHGGVLSVALLIP